MTPKIQSLSFGQKKKHPNKENVTPMTIKLTTILSKQGLRKTMKTLLKVNEKKLWKLPLVQPCMFKANEKSSSN